MRYTGLGVNFPRSGEIYILPALVDVGLRYPFCKDLEELCWYYCTTFTPDA